MDPQQPVNLRALVAEQRLFDYIKALLSDLSVKGTDALIHGQALSAISANEDWTSALASLKSQIIAEHTTSQPPPAENPE